LLVMRKVLEVLAGASTAHRLRVSITTKSNLVTRDLDLLTAISQRHDLSVNLTITTLSRRLARRLEPRAPRPGLRLLAVRELARAGIAAGVFIMPIVPGLTDASVSLEAIIAAASRAGASHLAHQVLFLRSSTRGFFYSFLRESFPQLLPEYRRLYEGKADGAPEYAEYHERLNALIRELRGRYGLTSRPATGVSVEPQLRLDFGQDSSAASAA
ncbi:MAG TPA: radical SAM protein, partial [Candidatus Polarisedimenticolia bacterium]|nr:radical SAM protein [Candidatus Polarisedimenticolia bacterium]